MNSYGKQALDFSRRHRPLAYAQIDDPIGFFAKAGEEIQADVTSRREEILGPMKPGEDLEQYRLRGYQALAAAEELTLAEHYLFRPEPEPVEETDSDEADSVLSRYYEDLAAINEARTRDD